jgi:hypothetical protein
MMQNERACADIGVDTISLMPAHHATGMRLMMLKQKNEQFAEA